MCWSRFRFLTNRFVTDFRYRHWSWKLSTTCSTWPDVKRPSRPGWGAKHSPLFPKIRNIGKKIARVPPSFLYLLFHKPQTSVFGMLYAILHHFSISKKSKHWKKNSREFPPTFRFSCFTGVRHPFSAFYMPFYIIFHALFIFSYHFWRFLIHLRDFRNFRKFWKIIFCWRHMSHAICHPTSFFML